MRDRPTVIYDSIQRMYKYQQDAPEGDVFGCELVLSSRQITLYIEQPDLNGMAVQLTPAQAEELAYALLMLRDTQKHVVDNGGDVGSK